MPSEPVVKESLTTAELVAWLREQAEARMVNTFSTLDQQEAESLDDAAKYATAANLIEQSAINNLRSRIYGLMDGFTSSSGPALEVELETVKAERDGLAGQVVDMQSKVQILLNKGLDISLRCLQNEISDNTAANEFIECFDGADQRRLSATLELPAAVAKVQEWREKAGLLDEYATTHSPKSIALHSFDWFLEERGWYRYTDPADQKIKLAKSAKESKDVC